MVCERWCVTKRCVKDGVAKDGVWQSCVCVKDGVVKDGVWQSCVCVWKMVWWNMVCDKVVCERWCGERWCETKWCVKDGVRQSCVWKMVWWKMVWDKVVCKRWCETKWCVKDGVAKDGVCVCACARARVCVRVCVCARACGRAGRAGGRVCCIALRCVAWRCVALRCGAVRCGALRCGEVWCGAVRLRCGAVRCGAVRRGAARCGAVRWVGGCVCVGVCVCLFVCVWHIWIDVKPLVLLFLFNHLAGKRNYLFLFGSQFFRRGQWQGLWDHCQRRRPHSLVMHWETSWCVPAEIRLNCWTSCLFHYFAISACEWQGAKPSTPTTSLFSCLHGRRNLNNLLGSIVHDRRYFVADAYWLEHPRRFLSPTTFFWFINIFILILFYLMSILVMMIIQENFHYS